MSEYETFYPPKPKLLETGKKKDKRASVITLMVMGSVFLFFFYGQWQMFFILAGTLLLHEFGHFIMMKFYGYKDSKMFLFPFFAKMLQNKKVKLSQRKRLLIILAGPVPGIVLGSVCFVLANMWQNQFLMWISIFLLSINLFNLLPIDPLDGGKVLETLLSDNHEQFKVVFAFASSIAFICIGYWFSSWLVIIFGFLMGFRVRMLQKLKNIRSELEDKEINYKKTYSYLSNSDYWQIRDTFILHTPGLKDVIPGHREVWDNEQLIASQINQLLIAPVRRDLKGVSYFLFVFIWLICIIAPLLTFLLIDLNWFSGGF